MRLRETFPATCWLLRQAKRRIIFWPVMSVLIICATLFTLLRIDAYLFRWKAERLLRTCESLQLTRPNSMTVLQTLRQFGEPTTEVFLKPYVPGQPFGYHLTIRQHWVEVTNWLQGHGYHSFAVFIFGMANLSGARGAQSWTWVWISPNGHAYATNFMAIVAVLGPDPYSVIAEVRGVRSVPTWEPTTRNPYLAFGRPGGCTNCIARWATYATDASPGIIHAAFDLDLHCFTSMKACTHPSDMMPRLREAERLAIQVPPTPACSQYWLARAGREQSNIALARVVRIRPWRGQWQSGWEIQLEPLNMLQGSGSKIKEPLWIDASAPENINPPPPEVMPAKNLHPGERILVLRGDGQSWCPLIVPSKQTIALVKDSIKRHKAEFGYEPPPVP